VHTRPSPQQASLHRAPLSGSGAPRSPQPVLPLVPLHLMLIVANLGRRGGCTATAHCCTSGLVFASPIAHPLALALGALTLVVRLLVSGGASCTAREPPRPYELGERRCPIRGCPRDDLGERGLSRARGRRAEPAGRLGACACNHTRVPKPRQRVRPANTDQPTEARQQVRRKGRPGRRVLVLFHEAAAEDRGHQALEFSVPDTG
jgi:hypothetical protein